MCQQGCGGCNDCGGLTCGEGAAGLNGLNAFTVTTATFLQPAFGDAALTINVSALGQATGKWAGVGQWIFIEGAGFFKVVTSTTTVLTVIVPSATMQTYNYTLATNGATIAIGAGVSPAGIEGAAGVAGAASTAVGPVGPANPSVLDVDFTEYIEDQNTFSAVSKSFNIPADTLEVNGDMVELEMYLISEVSDTAIYQVQVELDSNVINITNTFNTIFALGGKFFYVRLQLVLTDTDEVTPVVDSYTANSTSLEYAGNYSNGVAASKTMRVGNPTTGLNPSAILLLDVSLVSSVTGKNIKMFYYKLTSLKK